MMQAAMTSSSATVAMHSCYNQESVTTFVLSRNSTSSPNLETSPRR